MFEGANVGPHTSDMAESVLRGIKDVLIARQIIIKEEFCNTSPEVHKWSDNVVLSRIGQVSRHEDLEEAGDDIDRGLILARLLKENGIVLLDRTGE